MACFFSTHTLCGMLVFPDHIRKATTRQHSALTTALQNVPKEYTAKGSRGGEICRGKGREIHIFLVSLDATRHVARSLDNPVKCCGLHFPLTPRTKTVGLEDPDPSPSFAVWSGCTKRELPHPLDSSLTIAVIPSPWRRWGLRPAHQVSPET